MAPELITVGLSFIRRRTRTAAVAAFLCAAAVGAAIGLYFHETNGRARWTIIITNDRSSQLLVAGTSQPHGETTGYTVIAPHATASADLGAQNHPPDAVIFDFESHRDADGELVVVPYWQAEHKAIVCAWQDLKADRPIVVTDAALHVVISCARALSFVRPSLRHGGRRCAAAVPPRHTTVPDPPRARASRPRARSPRRLAATQ